MRYIRNVFLVLLSLVFGWVVFNRDVVQPSKINLDERIVFFNTGAHLKSDGKSWIVPIHGWIHELESSTVRKATIALAIKKKYGLKPTKGTEKNFDQRIHLFLVDNERGKRVAIHIGDKTFVMPSSRPNGHFHGRIELPDDYVKNTSAVTTGFILRPNCQKEIVGNSRARFNLF